MGFLFRPKWPTQRVSIDDVLDPDRDVSLDGNPACTLEILVSGGHREGPTHTRTVEPNGILMAEVMTILGDCHLYPKRFALT